MYEIHCAITQDCMTHRVTLIPGDGIGPEVSAAVLRIDSKLSDVAIEWERFIVGGHAQDLAGSPLPDEVIESVRRNGSCAERPRRDADRRWLRERQCASAQDSRSVRQPSARAKSCRACNRVSATSISLSCGKTRKVCTRVWNMKSFPASSNP